MSTQKEGNIFMTIGAEKLKTYMRKNGLSWQGMAAKCGISRQTIYNLLKGHHKQYTLTLRAVERATDGQIKVDEWHD